MNGLSDVIANIVDGFSRSSIYQGFFKNLPYGLDDAQTDLIILAVAGLLLMFLFMMIIIIATSKSKKTKSVSKSANKQVSHNKKPTQLQRTAQKSTSVTKTNFDESDIDRLLAEKIAERSKKKITKPDVNEFEQILNNLNKRNSAKNILEKQVAEEEKQKKHNMQLLDKKVSSSFHIEGAEVDRTSEQIKKMQEAEKQARLRELAEKKRRKR